MAGGNGSEGGSSPLWYAIGALVLVGLMMGIILWIKPLDFTNPPPASCEAATCEHDAAPAGAPEGVSHEHEAPPPAAHPE